MKKNLLTLCVLLAAGGAITTANAAEPMPVDTATVDMPAPPQTDEFTQVRLGRYTISAPPGVLQRENSTQLMAFLPDGSFGMSIIFENVRPKKKEMLNLAKGMATELHLDPANLKPVDQDGLKGWWISGRAEHEIITAMVVNHDTELLRVVILEKERLDPVGPLLVPTLARD